jgi:hypothetical protein
MAKPGSNALSGSGSGQKKRIRMIETCVRKTGVSKADAGRIYDKHHGG